MEWNEQNRPKKKAATRRGDVRKSVVRSRPLRSDLPRKKATARRRRENVGAATRAATERQVRFYCSQEPLGQLRVGKVCRDLTLQEMITNAIAHYINRPPANALPLPGDSTAL